ncbi:hypothetical protein DSO57_1022468 [Entomophthora muscae]|uniref:Uncharacterized protein n=2 Tax=Entomophthora muscae TaxID=34485 RepID=A0ACC2U2J5_9FUNG|nr:hypothetical protein DSO57_1012273 [Entomophthora muscae]KAJ9080672.1 hypothetical protein DSO57_1022468 [Entomophthora muscae]
MMSEEVNTLFNLYVNADKCDDTPWDASALYNPMDPYPQTFAFPTPPSALSSPQFSLPDGFSTYSYLFPLIPPTVFPNEMYYGEVYQQPLVYCPEAPASCTPKPAPGKSVKKPAAAKPYQVKAIPCTFPGCSKTFARKYNMENHSLIHLNQREKVHGCGFDACNAAFVRRHDLNRHLRTVHKVTDVSAYHKPNVISKPPVTPNSSPGT